MDANDIYHDSDDLKKPDRIKKVKPNIKEVHFSRKFNLGNYETMDVGFVATITEDQNPAEVLKALDKATIKYRKEREA